MIMRNCCAVHSAVGCAVVFQCRMRRVPTSRTTNTYTTRHVAATVTKKSHARNGPGVVPHKGAPGPRPGPRTRCPTWRHISANRSRRHPNPKLHEELRGDSLLAPSPIGCRHLRDQPPQVCWNAWTSRFLRSPLPKQPKGFSMPANQRVRLDNHQQLTPVDEPRQRDQRDASRVVRAAWPHVRLAIQLQLLSQEQVLSRQLRARVQRQESEAWSSGEAHRRWCERRPADRIGAWFKSVCDQRGDLIGSKAIHGSHSPYVKKKSPSCAH